MVESSELATALAVGSPDAHNSIPGFLLKLRVLVEDEGIDDIIHWGPGGITFIITNPVAFAEEILPIYFKHNHLASFIRQLNLYGFHKVTGVSDGGLVKTERECLEFRHPYFLRDKPEFLRMIKRKPATQHTAKTEEKVELGVKDIASQVPAIMSIASSVQQVMAKQAEIDKKMATLKSENEVLWREVASLHRKNMQQSQMVDKIVRFLVKLVQRPHKGRNAPVTPATAGRPIPLMIDRPSTSGKDSTGKPRTLSGLGLDSGSRTDHSPSGPVIHDVTELLRTSDGVTSLNSGDHKSVPSAGGATHVVQVMPTYISVPSPGDPHIVCAPSSVGSTSERAPSISATTSVEPEVSMPMSVAPVEAILGDENVLILDPNTLTLHPAPQLSYVLDGKKIIVNPDGTQSVVALEGNCGENQPAEGTSYIISDPTTMSISTSPCTSSPSTNATTVTSAGKSSGKQFPGKGRGKSVAGRKRTSIGEGEDVPQQKRSLYNENELRVAVPSNPFTFPSFVDTPTSSSSQQSGYVQNPVAETQLSSQFDVDKFLEYLTSSDAHFDVNELYKIVSDPAIVSKVTELDAASAASSKQQPLPVTSGSTPSSPVRDINVQAAQASSMTSVASAAKVLPDLSELMDEGDTHESYYKGLEQNEFQTLDTPLVDGLD